MGSTGDMEFGAFYREQHDAIVRLCWLATLVRGDAADAAQEALALVRSLQVDDATWEALHEQSAG